VNILIAILNFFHLLAAVVWIGGMLYATLVLMPAMEAIDPPQRGRLMGAVGQRFIPLVWISIAVLLVTGFLKTPAGMLFSLASIYGILLTVKHLVVLLMVINAALITFVLSPKMEKLAPPPGERPSPELGRVQGQLTNVSLFNTFLGVLLLLLVALF